MTSPSDEVFPGAAAWAEVAELNQRLYDARAQLDQARALLQDIKEAAIRWPQFDGKQARSALEDILVIIRDGKR